MSEDNVTLFREMTLLHSGFANVEEMGDAILELVSDVGTGLLAQDSLSFSQARGLQQALRDTRQAFAALTGLIKGLSLTEDQKANLQFALIKAMDDMISLGSLAAIKSGRQDIAFSVLEGAQKGGRKSGVTRLKKSEAWKSLAKAMALDVRERNLDWSQEKVATEIAALWKDDRPPGHTSLKDLIADLEQRGELPRRSARAR